MPYDLNADPPWCECPCGGRISKGLEDIEKYFGWRTMDDGKTIPQSYCRECRIVGCEAGELCKVNCGGGE